jgi:hypothetical protein
MLDVGGLTMPLLLDDQIEVFIDSEKLHSNRPDLMIAKQFPILPQLDESSELKQMTLISDLNQNECQWRHMGKSVCDFTRSLKLAGDGEKLQELTIDEITEFAIYDSPCKVERKDLISKKQRRVFQGTPISLRVVLRNTLGVALDIKNIKVVCQFQGAPEDETTYTQAFKSLALDPLQTKDVILQVVPLQTGDFEIKRVEWELFGVVRCARELGSGGENAAGVQASKKAQASDMALTFNVIEASGECEATLALDGFDLHREQKLLLSEVRQGKLQIRNCSPTFKIKNASVSCSHPSMLNFENKYLFQELGPDQTFELPVKLRAALVGSNLVKFLVRYEVSCEGGEPLPVPSRFRFQRLSLHCSIEQTFTPKYKVNVSTQKAETHLVNLLIQEHRREPGN